MAAHTAQVTKFETTIRWQQPWLRCTAISQITHYESTAGWYLVPLASLRLADLFCRPQQSELALNVMIAKSIALCMSLSLSLGLSPLSAAAQSASQDALPDAPGATTTVAVVPTGPTAVFDTSMGRMTCKLYEQQAPAAVANFIGLAQGTTVWTDPATHQKVRRPLYNGTIFHRVIPDFMIQGGDPLGSGTGDPGYYFADEFSSGITFAQPGMLAMANSGPNTNGSQFFITTAPAEHLNNVHTIFGQCDQPSIAVAQSIAAVPRNRDDRPFVDVVLNKVTIVPEGQPMPPEPPVPAAAAAPAPAAH